MGRYNPNVTDVLSSVRQMLQFARLGEQDFFAAGERKISGLYNAVTHGRSVTFVLQKLRGRADGFDDWYEGVQTRLRADPVAKWFVELRNRIDKEGSHGESSTSLYIAHLDTNDLMEHMPPSATGMFIGDFLGRSGWIETLPDGTEATTFFTLPPSAGIALFHIEDAPEGKPLEELLPAWLNSLESIVEEAEQRFGLQGNA